MIYTLLRAFHAVAREESFTRAALAANISQPTLSAQVRALEEHYSVRLFERRGRGVKLTDNGRALLGVTGRLFALEDEADLLLSANRDLARGHLNVSADSAHHVMPILAALRQRHPGLTFSLRIDNSDGTLQDVIDYRADIAVLAKLPNDPRFAAIPLGSDRLVIFIPKGHAWAKRKTIRLADLQAQNLVVREPGSYTRQVFEEALRQANVTPARVMEIQSREAVFEAVAAGFGVGVVFEREFSHDGRFAALAVRDAPLDVGEYIVCLEDRRRLAIIRAFLEVAKDFVGMPMPKAL